MQNKSKEQDEFKNAHIEKSSIGLFELTLFMSTEISPKTNSYNVSMLLTVSIISIKQMRRTFAIISTNLK